MRSAFLKIRFGLLSLISQEEGQDLVEYALVISLVAVGLVAAVGSFSSHLVTLIGNNNATLFP
jgi:Flp pilus assembly pilin Flp